MISSYGSVDPIVVLGGERVSRELSSLEISKYLILRHHKYQCGAILVWGTKSRIVNELSVMKQIEPGTPLSFFCGQMSYYIQLFVAPGTKLHSGMFPCVATPMHVFGSLSTGFVVQGDVCGGSHVVRDIGVQRIGR